ncbi:hypothetical protein AEGHOMDF_6032 [Methylobacterium soli]|nr:hypothetical protein AEGHOMDF_6032 [Methylobacterium soli]
MFDRASDAAGQSHWTGAIETGMSLRDLAEVLLSSVEGQGHHGGTDNRAFVESLYRTALHREGDADGVAQWVDALDHGAARGEVALGFALSPENLAELRDAFEQGVFTPDPEAGAVARLYYGLLDRAPDQGGLDSFHDAVERGMGLEAVARAVVESPEYAAKFGALDDAAFLENLYEGALGRAPDATGAQAWLGALGQGSSRAEVAVGVTQSSEAQQHLLPLIETGWHLV